MSTDAPRVERPKKEPISYFAVQTNEFAWTTDVVDEIRARREALSGYLFFDQLLKLGGIQDLFSLYPPKNADGLNRLLDAIESASYDSMKRDCLIFYLLRWHNDGRENTYAAEKRIPPHYAALADVFWQLDTGLTLEKAISKLADVRIVKDYTSKIIETLSLSPNSSFLIRKFMRLCKPSIRQLTDLERYLVALAEYSTVEAWQYQRTFPQQFPARKGLIHRLLKWAITPKPKSHALAQLLSVPFSSFEENVVQAFAMRPPEGLPDASVDVIRELVCVRLIQSCKYAAAVRFDKQFPASGAGMEGTWSVERDRIMKEVISTMPAIERSLLESELEMLDTGVRTSRHIGTSSSKTAWSSLNGSADLGASWEDLGSRAASASRRSIAERLASRSHIISRPGRMPNGTGVISFSTPGASSSAAHPQEEPRQQFPQCPQQPLSAQSTLVVEEGTGLEQSFTFVRRPSYGQTDVQTGCDKSKGKDIAIADVVSPSRPLVNGVDVVDITVERSMDDSSKTSAFATRNAFFALPQSLVADQSRQETDTSIRKSPKRQETHAGTQLPHSSQEVRNLSSETESHGLAEHEEDKQTDGEADGTTEADGRSVLSEHEDMHFFGFGGSVALTAPKFTSSPKSSRRPAQPATSLDNNKDRHASNTSFPGAFTSEDEGADEPAVPKSPPLKSPVRNNFGESISDSRLPRSPDHRRSRKRAASPEPDLDGQLRISIPGALFFEDDEPDSARTVQSGVERDRHRSTSPTGSEYADELGPLPSSSHLRGKGTPRTPRTPNGRSTSRRRVSRAESIDFDDSQVLGSVGRLVRRSSRLSATTASPSPALEKAEKLARPRKSTRTSKAGATATGKGATRRR